MGGGEKKLKRCGTWVVGEKKGGGRGEGERGRIYNGNRGRRRRKMGNEGILGVVKKINK